MGKNLKGKDCGKGIYQRKDGLYSARFVDKTGKRHEKYFQTIPEARNWMEEAKICRQARKKFLLPPKQRLTNGLVSGLKI
ncbi:MAG: hypothetical protein ACLU38_04095 [Dysosmobacter sp.]